MLHKSLKDKKELRVLEDVSVTTANHRGKTAGDQVEAQTLRLR